LRIESNLNNDFQESTLNHLIPGLVWFKIQSFIIFLYLSSKTESLVFPSKFEFTF